MTSVPATATKAVGDKASANWANNNVKSPIDWWMTSRPFFQSVQAVAQTGWTTSTYTALTWSTEVFDTDGQHTGSSSQVTIGTTLGLYRVRGIVCFAANSAATQIRAAIALNGTLVEGSMTSIPLSTASNAQSLMCEFEVRSTTGTDYVELWGFVTAASGTLGTNVSTNAKSSLTVEWIRS